MPIVVACPCGATLTVRSAFAGRRVECPTCRSALDVPTPDTGRTIDVTGSVSVVLPPKRRRRRWRLALLIAAAGIPIFAVAGLLTDGYLRRAERVFRDRVLLLQAEAHDLERRGDRVAARSKYVDILTLSGNRDGGDAALREILKSVRARYDALDRALKSERPRDDSTRTAADGAS